MKRQSDNECVNVANVKMLPMPIPNYQFVVILSGSMDMHVNHSNQFHERYAQPFKALIWLIMDAARATEARVMFAALSGFRSWPIDSLIIP